MLWRYIATKFQLPMNLFVVVIYKTSKNVEEKRLRLKRTQNLCAVQCFKDSFIAFDSITETRLLCDLKNKNTYL